MVNARATGGSGGGGGGYGGSQGGYGGGYQQGDMEVVISKEDTVEVDVEACLVILM
ncbi:hypothetical protein NW765_015015 [Fusarium oxysporum]|nr:hypothetical protein NW765_015015 [Fusarium oxysporum]